MVPYYNTYVHNIISIYNNYYNKLLSRLIALNSNLSYYMRTQIFYSLILFLIIPTQQQYRKIIL